MFSLFTVPSWRTNQDRDAYVIALMVTLLRKDTHGQIEDRTPHRTQHTRIFFSLRSMWHSCITCHVSSKASALAQRLESSQDVCRVLNTVRELHSHSSISCLVATSWVCLSVVLLFLTDWRLNRRSTATILAAVSGLAERLNSPLTQIEKTVMGTK